MRQTAQFLKLRRVIVRLTIPTAATILRRLEGIARAVASDVHAVLVLGDKKRGADVAQVLDAVDGGAETGATVDEVAAIRLDPDGNVEAVNEAEVVVNDGVVDGEVEEGDGKSRWRGVAEDGA
uniref:Uncharacterized protein n=1 Tax=Cucumis sativus TaxID=3659 RepID=A0A0A0LGE6_CUCSA